jgi:hypothetical protein
MNHPWCALGWVGAGTGTRSGAPFGDGEALAGLHPPEGGGRGRVLLGAGRPAGRWRLAGGPAATSHGPAATGAGGATGRRSGPAGPVRPARVVRRCAGRPASRSARHAGCASASPSLSALVRALHLPGPHGQVEPDSGGRPADAEGMSIQHPVSSQHQPVAAALLGVDLQAQLDQAGGAVGGERGHDPPGAAAQDLQALAAERPPPVSLDVEALRAAKPGIQIGVIGLDACRVQRHGQDRQIGWLLDLDDANRWELIEVDDPQAVQPTGDGPEPELGPDERDTAPRRVDGPGTG